MTMKLEHLNPGIAQLHLETTNLHAIDPERLENTGWEKWSHTCLYPAWTNRLDFYSRGSQCKLIANSFWAHLPQDGSPIRWLHAAKVRVSKRHDFVAQMVPVRCQLIVAEGQPCSTFSSKLCTSQKPRCLQNWSKSVSRKLNADGCR